MRQTPLFQFHKKAKAKIVGFSGWEMPLSYTGVLEEHRTVRQAVGLFDISHMGRIWVEGEGAVPFLQKLTSNDVERLSKGRAQYSLVLNERGGIMDDIFVYRKEDNQFLICVNASNTEKIAGWFKEQVQNFPASVNDRTLETGQIALQGPRAEAVLKKVSSYSLASQKLHSFQVDKVAGVQALVARTGYTGEPGVELFLEKADVQKVWDALVSAGKEEGIQPIGLGARDTLRLEMGYCLYGHEIDEETNPLDAGLGWVTKLEKPDFMGRDVLLEKKITGLQRKLVGFQLVQKGVPRQGCPFYSEGKEVGVVTSGNYSPTLGKGIGMGYVSTSFAEPGEELLVEIRGKAVPAEIVDMPFYRKKGKGTKK
ncbi:MAG TPA: glycine cleavage system aminomethyltransferase GcvT [Nitrospiria bacterium]|jgi:aminomethyltransferase